MLIHIPMWVQMWLHSSGLSTAEQRESNYDNTQAQAHRPAGGDGAAGYP